MAGITRKQMSSRVSFSNFGKGDFPLIAPGELAAEPVEAAILVSACDVMIICIPQTGPYKQSKLCEDRPEFKTNVIFIMNNVEVTLSGILSTLTQTEIQLVG